MAIVREQAKIYFEDDDINTVSITLDSAIGTGNVVFAALVVDKNATSIVQPSGYTIIETFSGNSVSIATAYKIAGVAESTTLTWSWGGSYGSRGAQCCGVEYSGLDGVTPLDVSAENDSGDSSVDTISTGTTATTAVAISVAVATMGADSSSNVEAGRSWTNSFSEILWAGESSGNPGLSIAEKALSATGAQESTFSTTDSGDQLAASIVVFKSAPDAVPSPRTNIQGPIVGPLGGPV